MDVYGNLFCAEFVGNPTMNFVEVVCKEIEPEGTTLASRDLLFTFKPATGYPSVSKGQELVLGLRPESLTLQDPGKVKGSVYSALPSGMETTVILKIRNTMLTAVVFGNLDFSTDGEIGLELNHDNYILFDRISEEMIAFGSLKISLNTTS